MTDYEKYQLEWMIKNDVSLKDIFNQLAMSEDYGSDVEYALRDYISFIAPKIWNSPFEYDEEIQKDYYVKLHPNTIEEFIEYINNYAHDFTCYYVDSPYDWEYDYNYPAVELEDGAHKGSKEVEKNKLAINYTGIDENKPSKVFKALKDIYTKLEEINDIRTFKTVREDYSFSLTTFEDKKESFKKLKNELKDLIDWINKYFDFD